MLTVAIPTPSVRSFNSAGAQREQTISKQESSTFAEISPQVLNTFKNRMAGDEKTINIPSNYGDFIFCEENGGVTISWNGKCSFHANKSIDTFHDQLALSVIKNPQSYPVESYDLAVEHIVTYAEDFNKKDEVIKAAQHIISNIKDFTDLTVAHAVMRIVREPHNFAPETVKLALLHTINHPENFSPAVFNSAAQQILKTKHSFSPEVVKQVACQIIRNSHERSIDLVSFAAYYLLSVFNFDNKMPVNEAAANIIKHTDNYPSELVKSSVIHIIENNKVFPPEIVKQAIRIINDNPKIYDKATIMSAAKFVVNYNSSFFKAASHDPEEFKKSFNVAEIEILKLYSARLYDILASDDRIIINNSRQFHAGRFVDIPQKLTPLSAWIAGQYMDVFAKNDEASLYIIENLDHEIFNVWNSKQKLLNQPDNNLKDN